MFVKYRRRGSIIGSMAVEINWWVSVTPIVISAVSLGVSFLVYRDSHRSKLKPLLLIEGMMDWSKMTYKRDRNGTLQGILISVRAVKNIPLDIEGQIIKDGVSYRFCMLTM